MDNQIQYCSLFAPPEEGANEGISIFCYVRLHWMSLRWIIDHPLDITVPSKHTPWPNAPPEIPIKEKVLTGTQEQTTAKHYSTKTRTSRSRRSRSKKKHDTKVIGVQVSTHSEQN
ncbi:putative beta-xylosyltransferase irx14h-like protein [Trifolium pratense]|uniref:Putative beta-xylosyltransferase irx14h-like protein n=1 Tax=Trifolium pratense TaxID=57577 RepID=A0A2K3N8C1_TRIPR|nr:putative beta-xylosyltransferase irx14h-like protein [Trifolium pratense]